MTGVGGEAVVLVAHGTVDALDDLPEFLRNIRRGHAAPPELIAEVRRRYEAIGGRSPLNAINRDLAGRLEARLGVEVRLANRLFRPYPKDVVSELAARGVRRIFVIPLAQHSAPVYDAAVREAAKELDVEVICAPNWGRIPELTKAFAEVVREAFTKIPPAEGDRTSLVLTAHSLPLSIIEAGDPYEQEVRGSADDVAAAVTARGAAFTGHTVAFQSQGMSTDARGKPMAWLGPDLKATLEALAQQRKKHVVIAPIGFLADHVEILYDLDIEAKAWAEELGMVLVRSASLNAGDSLVDALTAVARSIGAAFHSDKP